MGLRQSVIAPSARRRPERDRTPEDAADVEDPVVVEIAKRLGVHPAVVCVKWAVERGQAPIPLSTKRDHYLAKLVGAVSPPLSDADMRAIAAIDGNCRLIKGQVFLWKENQSWEDLWDMDGKIASGRVRFFQVTALLSCATLPSRSWDTAKCCCE